MAKTKASRRGGAEAATAAPPLAEALAALSKRSALAVGSLLLRIVALAVLITLLARQAPGLAAGRVWLEAAAVALAVWPFFTAMGRLYGWRLALGRAYVAEERWADAAAALEPLRHPRVRLLFDATGEGVWRLATAERALGRPDEARRLLTVLAGERRGRWSDEARAALETDAAPR